MPLLDQFASVYVPAFEMKVGGKPLSMDEAKRIIQVSVTEQMDPPNQFSFQMYDPRLEFIDPSKGKFKAGTLVELSLGYVNNVKNMIIGRISSITADFPNSGPPTIQVDGFDLLHELTYGTSHEKFDDRDSDIVKKIAGKHMEVIVSGTGTSTRTEVRNQTHISDLAFLRELARLNGYYMWVEGSTLHFEDKRPAPSIIPLEWGKKLISFSPRLSKAGQVKTIEVRGWHPGQKQAFSAREERSETDESDQSMSAQGSSETVYYDEFVSNENEARKLAKAILSEKEKNIVTGNGTCIGEPEMHVGSLVKLSKLGLFNGTHVVTSVTHTVGGNGYQTSFQLNSASGLSDLGSPSGAGDRNRSYGIVVGIVNDNKDAQMGKIQVKFPGLSDKQIVHQARIATLMAGNDRGTFFLPEKEDEVLVAFEAGNMSRPYIIGSLWNGKDLPPDTNDNGKNNLRFIKSRSGNVLCFDDTDGNEKIQIFDKEKKNIITMDIANNTITIKSTEKDINIEASNGTIKLEAKKIIISSNEDARIDAKGGLTLNGKPKDTIITGTKVNIN